jgi:hypothetical protein
LHYSKREEAGIKYLGTELPGQLPQDLGAEKYCLGNRNPVTVHAYRKMSCTPHSTEFKLPAMAICNIQYDLNCQHWPHAIYVIKVASTGHMQYTQLEHHEGEWKTKSFQAKLLIYLSEADIVADSVEDYRRQTKKIYFV